jgi:hypothetical protein
MCRCVYAGLCQIPWRFTYLESVPGFLSQWECRVARCADYPDVLPPTSTLPGLEATPQAKSMRLL